jgi:hypothetical protein
MRTKVRGNRLWEKELVGGGLRAAPLVLGIIPKQFIMRNNYKNHEFIN